MSRQVKCVNKQHRQNPHERILYIGGIVGGVPWKVSQIQAIADVERDPTAYQVVTRAITDGCTSSWASASGRTSI